jgi:hypothetical protein
VFRGNGVLTPYLRGICRTDRNVVKGNDVLYG